LGYGLRKAAQDAFLATARTPEAVAVLEAFLDGERTLAGEPLGRPSRWAAVRRLLALDAPGARARLEAERERDTSPEAQRSAFIAGAAIPNAEEKAAYFARYLDDAALNEEWVTASLGAFNDPLHAELTLEYLRPALEKSEWIRDNRRIFFLPSWIAAFVGGQTSEQALAEVDASLAAHPELPADIRKRILQARDEPERTVRIRARCVSEWRARRAPSPPGPPGSPATAPPRRPAPARGRPVRRGLSRPPRPPAGPPGSRATAPLSRPAPSRGRPLRRDLSPSHGAERLRQHLRIASELLDRLPRRQLDDLLVQLRAVAERRERRRPQADEQGRMLAVRQVEAQRGADRRQTQVVPEAAAAGAWHPLQDVAHRDRPPPVVRFFRSLGESAGAVPGNDRNCGRRRGRSFHPAPPPARIGRMAYGRYVPRTSPSFFKLLWQAKHCCGVGDCASSVLLSPAKRWKP